MRIIVTLTLLLVAILPPSVQAAAGHKAHTTPLPYGTWIRYHQHHIVWPDGRPDDRSGWLVTFPVRVVNRPMVVPQRHHASAKRTPKKATARRASAPRGRWVRVFTTGYDDRGTTASGLLAGYGRVAVDPRIFPFGTRFYIPGYGYAVAADTGGAVIGLHIDVWLPTASQCYAFTGWRNVEVLS